MSGNKYGARRTPCAQGHTHASKGGLKKPLAVKQGKVKAELSWPPKASDLARMYANGMTSNQIAVLYGCAMVTLRQHRARLGVEIPKTSLQSRFWSKVDIRGEDECWPWLSSKVSFGYGLFTCNLPNHHRTAKAHRLSWEFSNNSSLLPGAVIMHSCDNPSCVNPRHLSIGTKAENSADCCAKGRQARLRGELNGHSFVTKELVLKAREMNASGVSITKIAKRFGVNYPAMYNAVRKRSWAWL